MKDCPAIILKLYISLKKSNIIILIRFSLPHKKRGCMIYYKLMTVIFWIKEDVILFKTYEKGLRKVVGRFMLGPRVVRDSIHIHNFIFF